MADDAGPNDPLGTVRAGDGLLAIRAQNSDPDTDELSWFVVDISTTEMDGEYLEDQVDRLAAWPIVYQP
jgi:hypothetical protein